MSVRRPSISACLIVRDEEAFIGRCLSSLEGAVDEVVVVDTGSIDRTPQIARQHGARVVARTWPDDFSLARNWALEEAGGDWVFVIDADEELVKDDAGKLRRLAASGLADGYLVNVHHFPDNPDQHLITQHVALFRNDPRFRYKGAIHEQVGSQIAEAGGRLAATDVRVIHRGYEASVIAAKRKHERNLSLLQREAARNPIDPVWHYYLGQEYYGLGRLDEAAREYEQAFTLAGPDWKSPHAVPGVIRYSLGLGGLRRWGKAFELLERYRALYPRSSDLHYIQARRASQGGDPAAAAGLLTQALAYGDPPPGMFELTLRGTGSFKAWFEMGQAYERLHQKEKAAGAYLESLRSEPRYGKAARALTSLLLETDDPERVVTFMLERVAARELGPIDGVWEALLNARAYRQALEVLDQLDGQLVGERDLRQGITLLAMGDKASALEKLGAALEHEGTRDLAAIDGVIGAVAAGQPALARRFLEQVNADKFPAAAELLPALVAGAPNGGPSMNGAPPGAAREMTDETAAELVRYGSLMAATWVDPLTMRITGWHVVQRALAFGCLEVVDAVVQYMVDRGLPAAEAALALGKMLHAQGYRETGLELLLKATRDGLYDVGALITLARAALDQHDQEAAEVLLRKAVEVSGKHPAPVMALAALLAETGRRKAAVAVLDDALETNPYAGVLAVHRERLLHGAHSDVG
ncbi:MAG: glycosyltransferase, partial [Firmicutes bacterium]|nr:glycosyltransferase [Bacillota bacterium]